jgi:hypothetical protein
MKDRHHENVKRIHKLSTDSFSRKNINPKLNISIHAQDYMYSEDEDDPFEKIEYIEDKLN